MEIKRLCMGFCLVLLIAGMSDVLAMERALFGSNLANSGELPSGGQQASVSQSPKTKRGSRGGKKTREGKMKAAALGGERQPDDGFVTDNDEREEVEVDELATVFERLDLLEHKIIEVYENGNRKNEMLLGLIEEALKEINEFKRVVHGRNDGDLETFSIIEQIQGLEAALVGEGGLGDGIVQQVMRLHEEVAGLKEALQNSARDSQQERIAALEHGMKKMQDAIKCLVAFNAASFCAWYTVYLAYQ